MGCAAAETRSAGARTSVRRGRGHRSCRSPQTSLASRQSSYPVYRILSAPPGNHPDATPTLRRRPPPRIQRHPMQQHLNFYSDGTWVPAAGRGTLEVINPATEVPFATIALGTQDDVNRAVAAAKRAFAFFGMSSRQERIELLESVIAAYRRRSDEIALAISDEMGAPVSLARQAQAAAGLGHLAQA